MCGKIRQSQNNNDIETIIGSIANDLFEVGEKNIPIEEILTKSFTINVRDSKVISFGGCKPVFEYNNLKPDRWI